LGICNYSKVSDAVISRASGTNGRSKQMEGAFSIGELAQQVGVNVETIRYYERIGLMARPKRSNAGRRVYHQSGLQTLRFVRHARELGFSLDDIRSLLKHRNAEDACVHVKVLAERRLENLRAEMRRALEVERLLAQAVETCSGSGPATECTVLQILEDSGSSDSRGWLV
jgi:MerR family mercuric resistance operon transcriptional regulator